MGREENEKVVDAIFRKPEKQGERAVAVCSVEGADREIAGTSRLAQASHTGWSHSMALGVTPTSSRTTKFGRCLTSS